MSRFIVEKQLRVSGGAKGDIIARSTTAFDNLAAGPNGQVLTTDSTQTLGVKWAAPTASAANVTNTPAGNIAATDVQAAINELDSEKAALSHTHSAADITLGVLAVVRGGTGQSNATAAFDALSPATTKGDLIVNNGTNDIRLPVGTNGQVLKANSATVSGVEWAAEAGGLADPGANGMLARTALGVTAARILTAGSTKIAITNGDGVAGNPTIDATEANFTLDNLGGTLSISKGGTGQTAQTAAFDALAPTTTKGDLIAHNGTNNVRFAVGTNGQVIVADSAEASGMRWATSPPAAAGGSDTQIQFNDLSTLADANQLSWDKINNFLGLGGTADEKFHVQRGVDGDAILALFENNQAAAAASLNETAQVRFGFGTNNDVARIVAGKTGDYTSVANEDSFLAFYADDGGTPTECGRFDGVRRSLFIADDPSQDFLSVNAHGIKIHTQNKTSVFEMVTDWDTVSVNSQFLARTFSGSNTSAGFIFRGRSIRGTVASPAATNADDNLIRISAGGYTTSEVDDRGSFKCEAVSTWSGSNAETQWIWQLTPNASVTPRDSMILRSGGILEVDANADGDVIRIKQGGVQEGQITVSGTTVAYQAFMGAHPTQLKSGQQQPPIGGVCIATGEIIPPELTEDAEGRPIRPRRPGEGRKRPLDQFPADAMRFSHISSTTTPSDPRVYGVYFSKDADDTFLRSFGKEDSAAHSVASVGLWQIRVTDTAGNIAAGDYLTSSSREWEAERQADDVLHSYTVAKALVSVDWETVPVDPVLGYKWQLIPATIHCG